MRAVVRAVRHAWRAIVVVLVAEVCPGIAGATEPLRSIAEIHALPLDEFHARRPVVVRGVVTVLVPLLIQDGEFGVRVNPPGGDPARPSLEQLAGLPLELGADVEVSGVVGPGRYAPEILMHSVRRLGTHPLPEPEPLELSRLFAGGYVGLRVRAQGVVQAVFDNSEGWSLVVESAARRFRVVVNKHLMPSRPEWLIDAEVEVVGGGYAFRNSRGEFLSPGLYVARTEDLRVVLPQVADAFQLPMTPLNAIARFRSKPLGGHRLRTSGIVSFGVPGLLYVQDGIGGVRVELAPTPGTEQVFQAGDRIEVAGFPDVSTGIGAILWAVARKVSAGPAPAPVEIQPSEIRQLDEDIMRAAEITHEGSHDGCLIRCRGRIEAVQRSAAGLVLYLLDQDIAFMVTFADGGGPNPESFAIGSDVEVTGIVRIPRGLPQTGDILQAPRPLAQVELLVSNADDMRVVRLPPWWTPRRLAAAAAAAAGLAMAAFSWVTILRREVARQTSRAMAEESARFKATIDYEITLRERSRLAVNLHDTLLQALAGSVLQIDLCRRSLAGRRVEAAGDQLDVAKRMVKHAADDLRNSVWELRTAPLVGQSLADSLRSLVSQLGCNASGHIRLHLDGESFPLPRFVAGNLLLVVQEAIRNAQHHAGATAIDVTVRFDAPTRHVELTVADDGSGFAWGTQRGPERGHFGLQGMRERIEAIRGRFAVETSPGRGTRVIAEVPVQSLDAAFHLDADHLDADHLDADALTPGRGDGQPSAAVQKPAPAAG